MSVAEKPVQREKSDVYILVAPLWMSERVHESLDMMMDGTVLDRRQYGW